MSLIDMLSACLAFNNVPLLDNAELHIENNERICLVGRNGVGKSTLMRVLTKEQPLDNGRVIYQQKLLVSSLQQNPPYSVGGTVFDFVAEGIKEQANYIKSFYQIAKMVEIDPSEKNLNKLAELEEILDCNNLWILNAQINNILKHLHLPIDSPLSTLSGGWLRKAALARVLVSKSDVLFLDEPTNHLDVTTVLWLERFLKNFQGSMMFISHDRSFIRHLATRIVDLDRGKLVSWCGNYDDYLVNKKEALRVEAQQNAKFDRKLAQEEVWMRQGIKARRTRNEGRVRALKSLREKHSKRNEVVGLIKTRHDSCVNCSGKVIFNLKDIYYYLGKKVLINKFSAQVRRGSKIALIGPNGCGKTTLLKLMLGQLEVVSGNIYRGTKLEIAYFDQYRLTLDPDKTVVDNLSQGAHEVIIDGQSRHVLSYLQDFLFRPEQATMPVKVLSGGEKNRLLLARLFLKPSNLLILDEPTNDLDIETLELLENLINSYKGTILLVSHDRQFVCNTITEFWVFKEYGKIECYVGDNFYDILLQSEYKKGVSSSYLLTNKSDVKAGRAIKEEQKQKTNKISYHLLRELEKLPAQLEVLEAEYILLQSQVSEADFFNHHHDFTGAVLKALANKEAEIEIMFKRWQELELLKGDS